MFCQTIVRIYFYILIVLCLPLSIYLALIQTKLNRLLKAHGIQKNKINIDSNEIPIEVTMQFKLFKKYGYINLGIALFWIVSLSVLYIFC